MNNEFESEIKAMEREILDLKTASEYTSIRSANYESSFLAGTGVYRVNYASGDGSIFSIIISGSTGDNWGLVYPRTPSGNHQDVEVDTYYYDDQSGTYKHIEIPLAVISNRPVVSITKIS